MTGVRLRAIDGLLLAPGLIWGAGLAVWMLTEAPYWAVWSIVAAISIMALLSWAALALRRRIRPSALAASPRWPRAGQPTGR